MKFQRMLMRFLNWKLAALLIVAFVISTSSCRREKVLTDSSAKLEFSTDTVIFDTVFTTVGSTTSWFTVHNKNSQKINISKIWLQSGTQSNFRINADGVSGTEIKDVEILANDSIFVFAEVTLDPNSGTTPLIVEDSIMFSTNGNTQKVVMTAWGQDAYFHHNVHVNGTWATDKPHVIYGVARVDSGNTLNIQAGTRVHVHGKSRLQVYNNSKLNVKGTFENPVKFCGDRLEEDYQDKPGQWVGIEFYIPGESKIEFADIQNAEFGITVDSAGTDTVFINNTVINNSLSSGMRVRGGNVTAVNCLVSNAGLNLGVFWYGGNLRFNHCTFANYWAGSRSAATFSMKNYRIIGNSIDYRPFNKADFVNCVFYGNNDEEFEMDTVGVEQGASSPIYKFENCLLKTDEDEGADFESTKYYINVVENKDPKFVDPQNNDFHLSAGSVCVERGKATSVSQDIEQKNRTGVPDIGCYEL